MTIPDLVGSVAAEQGRSDSAFSADSSSSSYIANAILCAQQAPMHGPTANGLHEQREVRQTLRGARRKSDSVKPRQRVVPALLKAEQPTFQSRQCKRTNVCPIFEQSTKIVLIHHHMPLDTVAAGDKYYRGLVSGFRCALVRMSCTFTHCWH